MNDKEASSLGTHKMFLPIFIAVAIALRLYSASISIRHERSLKADGAVEHGAANTRLLALAHVAFYLSAFAEGLGDPHPFDAVTVAGLVFYAGAMVMLAVVVRLLGRLWTVKLLIARDHALVTHPLFRLVRHPNYFLNILPELIGLGLVCHAFYTLAIGLPLYLIPLVIRIRQEEMVMSLTFKAY
ncbi:Isoprenylcysteine carboxyl methyltransferase family-domain-containing protein [Zopfochytrium polystomum]|nr:Isoprenylcysteine carboxyl methyltransferase family-domain-containing protein [Zopfochytrium polystomum]